MSRGRAPLAACCWRRGRSTSDMRISGGCSGYTSSTMPPDRVFSGIQPSGVLHPGQYLGAIGNYIALQERYEAIYCIVDYHALTSTHDPETIRRNTAQMALALLAMGLDPERATLFVQSDRPGPT